MKRLVLFILAVVILLGLYLFIQKPSFVRDPMFCIQHGGNWLWQYNECERITQAKCNEIGGNFNGCESSCRHDPQAQMCIMLCVPVCKVK